MAMTEPTIVCPNCKTEIKLTESLAAPLVEATKKRYEQLLTEKDDAVSLKEKDIQLQKERVAQEREALDATVAEKLKSERKKIAEDEKRKAELSLSTELSDKESQLKDLQGVLKNRDAKLAEAQKARADLMKRERELEEEKREIELSVQKQVQAAVGPAREKARKEAEDEMKLKVKEREETISGMQRQIEELKRKAEQGSQQLQGEVQELELETVLKAKFPMDRIEPVPKGEHGGDVVHRVMGPLGQVSGTILWESKRTKAWSDGWLAKLRDDQRVAKADIAVIISQALPKDVENFELVEGIWVAHPRVALPLATLIRQSLIELALSRQAGEGQQTKMELIYTYLTGPRFRQRVEAIVEAFSMMKEDLDKEKKAIMKQWAKREEQINRVMEGTVGMYGDLQGIAGQSIQEIEALGLRMLGSSKQD